MRKNAKELEFISLWPENDHGLENLIDEVKSRFVSKKNVEEVMIIHQLISLLSDN